MAGFFICCDVPQSEENVNEETGQNVSDIETILYLEFVYTNLYKILICILIIFYLLAI